MSETTQLSRNGRHTDQLPIHDAQAEADALGCVFACAGDCDGQAESYLAQLDERLFYDQRNLAIFRGLLSLEQDTLPLTVPEFHQFCIRNQTEKDCGGLSYYSFLDGKIPSHANFPTYLDVLKDRAARRQMLAESARMALQARDLQFPVEHSSRLGPLDGLPAVVDATELVESSLKEPQLLVHHVLHQGTKLALGGGSKSFKTWILLDLAIAVSTGKPWLGFETQQSKVLYLNMEIKEVFFQKRIMRICEQRGVQLQKGYLDTWNLQGHTASFEQLMPKIIDRIKTREYGLIILDPIYKLYGNLDENKAGDVGRLMSSMDRLCFQSGASTAFGAHFSKGNQSGKEAIDRMSGSGVFARDPDSILTLTAHEEEMAFVVESTLRNLPPVNPFVVRWDFPCMNRDSDLDPAKLKKVAGRPQTWDAKTILECLPESGLNSSDWQAKCEDEKGVSKATFYRLKSELANSGKILLSKIHNRWIPIITKST